MLTSDRFDDYSLMTFLSLSAFNLGTSFSATGTLQLCGRVYSRLAGFSGRRAPSRCAHHCRGTVRIRVATSLRGRLGRAIQTAKLGGRTPSRPLRGPLGDPESSRLPASPLGGCPMFRLMLGSSNSHTSPRHHTGQMVALFCLGLLEGHHRR